MRRMVFGILSAAACAGMFAAAVGTASARNFSIGSENGFRVRYGFWELEFAYNELTVIISCPATLEGSFHSRTFAKVASSLIGYMTRAVVREASCSNRVGPRGEIEWPGAKMRVLSESLPWHARYNGFSGVLPAVTAVRMTFSGPAIRITELPFSGSCLYRASATAPWAYLLAVGAAGEVTGFNSDARNAAALSEGTFLCYRQLISAGNGPITQLTTSAALTVRLI